MPNISYSGTITDNNTNNQIGGATVTIRQAVPPTFTESILGSTTANGNGEYSLSVNANLGGISVQFSAATYRVEYASRTVTETGTNNFRSNIKLIPV